MSKKTLMVFILQGCITVSLLVIGWEHSVPWSVLIVLAIIALEAATGTRRRDSARTTIPALWIAMSVAVGLVPILTRSALIPERQHSWLAFLIALTTWLTTFQIAPRNLKHLWRIYSMTWAALGVSVWLWVSYVGNQGASFYAGLGTAFILLLAAKRLLIRRDVSIQAANTLLLLILGLPLMDLMTRPRYTLDQQPDSWARCYSYEGARKDPVAFMRWWNYYLGQWNAIHSQIYMPDPDGILPFRLIPNGRAKLFESEISINSHGFRGPPIQEIKDETYRIVVIGESTTFGCTLHAGDRPWPEWLHQMIEERLKPRRPVEVINTGVPTFTLQHNLDRMTGEILPLKPDLIIAYHGYNGFSWLDASLPQIVGRRPPIYRERPLRLLADCEHHLKMLNYRYKQEHSGAARSVTPNDPMQTQYARAYESLIRIAQTNHIQLALANFSMAVNSRSDRDVKEFYRSRFPRVYEQIEANTVHSAMLTELVRLHPEVFLINTHSNLDGNHDQFIDLIHFAESGRQQLAESVFTGIRELIENELK